MKLLTQVITARWFPTVTKPLLAGAVASGITFGLHAAGITAIVPNEVNSAVTPLVGLLVTAIVQKTGSSTSLGTVQVQATVATHTTTYQPQPTLGRTIAQTLLDDVAQEIDANPALVQSLAAQALERILHPAQAIVPAPAREVIATGNEAPHTN